MEPAVDAISAPMAALDFVWMAGLDRPLPRGDDYWEVIRMNDVGRRPTFQFLERLAEVFQDWSVDDFDFTGRCHDRDQGRNAIDDLCAREP